MLKSAASGLILINLEPFFFFYHYLSTLFIFKISVCGTIFINFYCKCVFRKVEIKSFISNTLLSLHNFSFKCNLQCTYDKLFIEVIFVNLMFSVFSSNFSFMFLMFSFIFSYFSFSFKIVINSS